MKQKTKAYLAGKVTGEDVNNVAWKFAAAQLWLEARGFEVVNPIELVNDWRCPWDIAMKKCITAMLTCECLFFLPGWEKSKGAFLEHHIARTLGMKIIEI